MDKSIMIHPQALLESDSIGRGTRIWAFAHVMKGATLGEDCNIGEQVFIESGVTLGDRVTVKNGVAIWAGVTIEDDVFIGPNAVFTNDLYPRSKVYHAQNISTLVRRGASIGANSTVIAGVELGQYSMVGAGSVVTRSVKDFELVFGNPATHRGWMGVEGEKLAFADGRCMINGRLYLIDNSQVKLEEA